MAYLLLPRKGVRFLIAFCLFVAGLCSAWAGTVPLTFRDVSLMLRSGYTSDAVLQELATRHFADVFDSTVEEQLVRAGASESLIAALRTGSYAATDAEVSTAREKSEAQKKQTVLLTPPPPRTQVRPPLSTPGPTKPAAPSNSPDAIYRLLWGDLVHLERGEVRKYDDGGIAKKRLFLLFFSSELSAPGRAFTAPLIAYYRRVAPFHPEFEIIFFSQDPADWRMVTYMQHTEMPWPAVVFDKVASKVPSRRRVSGLPLLNLVTGDAKILYRSAGAENADPDKVFADLDKILATSSASPHAPPPLMLSNTTDYFRP